MPVTMPRRPTPEEFRDAYKDGIMSPALTAVSGRDGRTSRSEASRIGALPGSPALASSTVDAYFDKTGYGSSSTPRVVAGASQLAYEPMKDARGADGTVDPTKLPPQLQVAFRELGGAADTRGYRFSKSVLDRVMRAYGLDDAAALIEEATRHDTDGNRYLKRSELEAAAKSLTGSITDLGIVSDLDKTIIPPHDDVLPANAYPGIAQLLVELEAVDGKPGDLSFVTARQPDRVTEVPAWLAAHGVPPGPIDTGISGIPSVASAEKIRDITRLFEASPGKTFVLFGDTSHVDPEAYRAIRSKFGDRVVAAFVHRVTDDVPADRVEGLHLIDDYAQAAEQLHDLGVLGTDAARRVMVAAQSQGLDITDAEIDRRLRT